ncbi:MAG: helicase C-terminal domain-containing protein [Limnochordia bacterium]|nr:helicase C-terminal domain-containing protein [Bacillota bacterium]HOB08100.1 helicase C-terminal domain-containing protein [Limnochordia bacterium]HPZ30205.1 helicase C-terminal domain-containing protein [Limnochordia bacterium]HQD70183.1 helicase C-terminal domain-containing protein [Limnochordia bacterium]
MEYDGAFFLPSGPLAQLEGYEYREQQRRMADLVYQVLTHGHIGLIEAGTGTGKSLAYLYPAVCYARATGEKIVVSTNTINLQEQLLEKDIPILKKLGCRFKAVVVKGWNNYPCWLRLNELLEQVEPDSDTAGDLRELEQCLIQEALPLIAKSFDALPADLKEQVQAEPDLCGRGKCSFFNQCPVFINKRLAETADIVIANHHLLLADISIRQVVGWQEQVVLPLYSHVVVDEAHHIEDVATEYFSVQLSMLRIRRLLGFLYRSHGKNRGILASLRAKINLEPMHAENDARAALLDWQLLPQLRIVDEAAARFFQVMETECFSASTEQEAAPIPYGGVETLPVLESYDRFHTALVMLKGQLSALSALLDSEQQETLAPHLRRVEAVIADLEFIMNAGDRSYVYWVKRQPRQQGCLLQAAPILVGEQLKEHLLLQVKSAIFTSATLSVGGDFAYFRSGIGIDRVERWDIQSAVYASPFDYANQVYLAVAKDMPLPDQAEFVPVLVEHLESILKITCGRAFVLFTSYAMLQKTLEQMKKRGLDQRFLILMQGEMPRTEMLDLFREKEGAVLLGTDSFWEGVDVPGEALSAVIITKLPFRVPTEPIVAARSEHLQANGINPFMHYFLPQAVLKFRQGCGRLIRTQADRGLILICDRRVMDRGYGKHFLQSLPTCPARLESLEEIEHGLKAWYQSSACKR